MALIDNKEKNLGDAEWQFIANLKGRGLETGPDMLVPHLKRIRRALRKEKHPVSKQDVSQWDGKRASLLQHIADCQLFLVSNQLP